MAFTLSLLYGFNQLASSLEDGEDWDLKGQGTADKIRLDTGTILRKKPGPAGLRDGEAVGR